MSDENKTKADAPTPEPTQPVDAQVEATPHPNFENPGECVGEVIPDPWDDDTQTDWPNGHIDHPEVNG